MGKVSFGDLSQHFVFNSLHILGFGGSPYASVTIIWKYFSSFFLVLFNSEISNQLQWTGHRIHAAVGPAQDTFSFIKTLEWIRRPFHINAGFRGLSLYQNEVMRK